MVFAEFFSTISTCKIHVSAKDLKEKKAQHAVQVMPEVEPQPQITRGERDSCRV